MTHPRPVWIAILALLALAAAGCNLPARTPGGAPSPTAPGATPAAATSFPSAITILPPELTAAPGATGTPLPTPGAPDGVSPTPTYRPVDRRDPNALIAGVRAALQHKDSRFFAQLAPENLSYVDYIEGGQPVERAKLLADLEARLAAGSPQCTQFGVYEQTLQVWTSGWNPPWQIDQICYQGCTPLNPPHTSQTAAFFFDPNASGEYELSAVWLNDDNLWRSVYQVTMRACDAPSPPLPTLAPTATLTLTPTATPGAPAGVFACPGAPLTRLKSGDRAYASIQSATPNRVRAAPNTGTEILGLIQPGQVVEILDGPQCAQGYVWWQVRLTQGTPSGSLTGWTAEGTPASYWLEPCTVAKCGQP